MKNLTKHLKAALYMVLVLLMLGSFNACGGGDTGGEVDDGVGEEVEENGGVGDEEGVGEEEVD
jgi:hypothetical protein